MPGLITDRMLHRGQGVVTDPRAPENTMYFLNENNLIFIANFPMTRRQRVIASLRRFSYIVLDFIKREGIYLKHRLLTRKRG